MAWAINEDIYIKLSEDFLCKGSRSMQQAQRLGCTHRMTESDVRENQYHKNAKMVYIIFSTASHMLCICG
jgi:hypothetical protein